MPIYDFVCPSCNLRVESQATLEQYVSCPKCFINMTRQFPLSAKIIGGTDVYQEALDRKMRQPKASKARIDKAREVAETMNQHFGAQNE